MGQHFVRIATNMFTMENEPKTLAFCFRCKGKHTIVNPTPSQFKNGTPIVAGACEVCGSKLFKIVGKKKTV